MTGKQEKEMEANTKLLLYAVRGAKCEGCLNDVKKRLSAVPGITGVNATFVEGLSTVTISSSKHILQEDLQV